MAYACACLTLVGACKKGSKFDNELPETHTSVEAINLNGENRLNSLVTLRWWGTDPDGVVDGYEFSFDQQEWFFTTDQDSTFLFAITEGSDTIDIDFWVRAMDDEGAVDQTPAYLRVPLKNTPPEIEFIDDLIPSDTAFIILTLTWEAYDLDGLETIKNIEIKANDGNWTSISSALTEVSIIPDDTKANGAITSGIYVEDGSKTTSIDGLKLNDHNDIYIRAIDIASSISIEDTIPNIYLHGQEHDLLVIAANGASPNAFYKSNLNALSIDYDFIDYVRDGAKNQPRIWNPTFEFTLSQYEQVLLYANDQLFTNVQTNAQEIILEFASTAIQTYVDNGGKIFITSSFPNAFSTGSALFGILPIDSLSTSEGQARLPTDSLAEGVLGYPDLTCSAFISGLDPIYPSSDADVIYTAQLTKNNDWEGPNNVGVRRQNGDNTNMVFLSLELHKLDNDPSAVQQLFDKVLKQEFNW